MRKLIPLVLLAALPHHGASAYGGGGGSSGCEEPKFFQPQPAGSVSRLTDFSFIASDNTVPESLSVEINGEKIKPILQRRNNGDYEVRAVPAAPATTAGRTRIGITAKSTGGCSGFQAYYVDIKP